MYVDYRTFFAMIEEFTPDIVPPWHGPNAERSNPSRAQNSQSLIGQRPLNKENGNHRKLRERYRYGASIIINTERQCNELPPSIPFETHTAIFSPLTYVLHANRLQRIASCTKVRPCLPQSNADGLICAIGSRQELVPYGARIT